MVGLITLFSCLFTLTFIDPPHGNNYIINHPIASILHARIVIDGNDELNDFCAGNGTDGTASNPHVIQYYEFTQDMATQISLSNTNLHVVVLNCTISSSGDIYSMDMGINLNNATNVRITQCWFERNKYDILGDNNCDNLIISGNKFAGGNEVGFINGSTNLLLENNTFLAETRFLRFNNTRYLRILNNSYIGSITCHKFNAWRDGIVANNTLINVGSGFWGYGETVNATFINNSLLDCRIGFTGFSNVIIENNTLDCYEVGLTAANSIIKNNIIKNCSTIGMGISNCTVKHNIIENCSGLGGIYYDATDHSNLFLENKFYNNTIGIFDESREISNTYIGNEFRDNGIAIYLEPLNVNFASDDTFLYNNSFFNSSIMHVAVNDSHL